MSLFRFSCLAACMTGLSCASGERDGASTPEIRAVAFLAREVPAWPAKNKCFSCHNNGDAARALYAARRLSIPFDPRSLESTTRYLSRPEEWKHNGPEGKFSDKKLADLQFAFALAAATETGAVASNDALLRAAQTVRDHQEADGSWMVDADGLPGSPVTYGRTLATVAARRVLAQAGFSDAVGRADAWLRLQRPTGVLDAAAALIGLTPRSRDCIEILVKGQSRDGGWGPYVDSPPEVFDTAIALLGLATVRDQAGVAEMMLRGRAYLMSSQEADGSWPETTRPAGAESYAQRISTTGWAVLALLACPAGP